MAKYGFVTIYDTATNLNNVITVTSYAGSVVKQINHEAPHSVYKFARDGFELLERSVTTGTELPYTLLIEICKQAVKLDKANEHIITMCFHFDANNELVVSKYGINKNIFPLPQKNIGYMWSSTYADVTNHFFNANVIDNLTASVARDLLNNVAVVNGIVDDRLFEFSCGHLFVNASFLLKSHEGTKLLKQITPHYDIVCTAAQTRCTSLKIKRSKSQKYYNCNNYYINKIVEIHTKNIIKVCSFDVAHHICNANLFAQSVCSEVESIRQAIINFSEQIPLVKPKDFDYLSISDIMLCLVDADFRYELSDRVAIVRKIYNANKHKNIICINSDGTVYCT